MNDKQQEVARTGGELLAAEVMYLRAHGWTPFIVPRPGKRSLVRWSKAASEQSIPQETAIVLQKAMDPLMGDDP